MTPDHERSLLVLARAEGWRGAELVDEAQAREIRTRFAQPWRAHGLLVQAVFFVLTCVAQLAVYGLAHTLDVPGPGIVTGVAALAVAELLIGKRRWFATGVESALWLGGLVALITELPRSGRPEALLVFAAAAAAAGFRVRNAFFGIAAAAIVVAYGEARFDGGTVFALAIGTAAMLALLRTWRRPSTELLCAGMAVVMPVAGRVAADREWRTTTIALYAVWGALALFLAFRHRHHALFLAAAAGLAIAGADLAERIAGPMEAKLAAGGVLLLALAWGTGRALRDRRSGIVVEEVSLTGADDALEVAGALGAADAVRVEPPARTGPGGGGTFGGGGASGEF